MCIATARFQCCGLLCMPTETASACLWLSDGQIYLLEDDRFKNLSKEVEVGDRVIVLKHISVYVGLFFFLSLSLFF